MKPFLFLFLWTATVAWGQGVSETPQQTLPTSNASVAEALGASPSASAATNLSAIQNALNVSGNVTLSRCGTYKVNGPLVIKSKTRFQVAPCVQLLQTAGTNNNLLVNYAYTHRGYLSSNPNPFTFSTGASGCGANKTVFVSFTNGTGIGGYGSIQTNSSGVPTGNVKIINPGAYYTSTPPTSAVIYNPSGSFACSSGGTTSSPATFTGGSVTNPIAAVSLSWSSSAPESVTVTWPGHPFWTGGSTLAQQAYVTISNASPSAFNGTFLVETVPSAATFTYRLRRNPGCGVLTCSGSPVPVPTDHGGSVVAMQADQDILIDGGTWHYNGPNNSSANGLNIGASFLLFALDDVVIRNLNFIQPKQDTIILAAVTDGHVYDIAEQGSGAVQFFECQGACYNVEVEHISTVGWDDGMSFITRIQSGYYNNVILSYGDVMNSGFRHINRVAPNHTETAASAETVFFASPTEYMGGIYARDITGSLYGKTMGPDISCVALGTAYASGTAVIDTADVENINCTGTWAFRIGAAPPATIRVNHATVKNITCNPQANSGGEGEECVQFTGSTSVGKAEIEKLNYTSTAHTSRSVWQTEIGGSVGEIDFLDDNVQGPDLSNPVGLVQLTPSAAVTKMNFTRVQQTNTSAMILDLSKQTSPMTVTIRDSTISANAVSYIGAASSSGVRNYILRDNTFIGLASGAVLVAADIGPTTVNVYSSGNSLSGSGNGPAINPCGASCVVNLFDSGERGTWRYSTDNITMQPPGPCQGSATVAGGTVSGQSYCSFALTVGAGMTSESNVVMNMPFAAPHRWICSAQNSTAPGTRFNFMTNPSTRSVGVANYSFSTAAGFRLANFTSADVILLQCSFD